MSSGVRVWAPTGLRVVAVARRKDRLEALQARMHALGVPNTHFLPVVCDVTKDAEVATLPRIVAKRWPEAGGVDVLVNNAGEARSGVGRQCWSWGRCGVGGWSGWVLGWANPPVRLGHVRCGVL